MNQRGKWHSKPHSWSDVRLNWKASGGHLDNPIWANKWEAFQFMFNYKNTAMAPNLLQKENPEIRFVSMWFGWLSKFALRQKIQEITRGAKYVTICKFVSATQFIHSLSARLKPFLLFKGFRVIFGDFSEETTTPCGYILDCSAISLSYVGLCTQT